MKSPQTRIYCLSTFLWKSVLFSKISTFVLWIRLLRHQAAYTAALPYSVSLSGWLTVRKLPRRTHWNWAQMFLGSNMTMFPLAMFTDTSLLVPCSSLLGKTNITVVVYKLGWYVCFYSNIIRKPWKNRKQCGFVP